MTLQKEEKMRKPKHDIGVGQLKDQWLNAVTDSRQDRKVLLCETITPLYGGGVKAGEVDPQLPIRPSALRGQWRFWWRLLHRGTQTSQELFRHERQIWGGIGAEEAVASQVAVRLLDFPKVPELTPAFEYVKHPATGKYRSMPHPVGGISDYALFSAQGKASAHTIETEPHRLARSALKFQLQIDCPDEHWPSVLEALRWWASFGGVGARTRRGLGAVKAVRKGSADELAPVRIEEVIAAGGQLALGKRGDDAMVAWRTAVDVLREFRQGLGTGRRGTDPKDPGQSYWPEPDEIRRLSRTHSAGHEPRHPVGGLFPRAAFGLPIVFHFKDAGKRPADPGDHTLEPQGEMDRMASPLVLRAYWDGEGYRPAALLLPGWEQALSTPLEFRGSAHHGLQTWPSDSTQRAAAAAQIHPMKGRGDDPLSAFLEFFRREVR